MLSVLCSLILISCIVRNEMQQDKQFKQTAWMKAKEKYNAREA